MDWLLENTQIVIVLVVVVGVLVQKVLEGMRSVKPAPPHTPPKDPFGRQTAPADASPPPIRQVAPPADMESMDFELARQREMQERLRKIREAKAKTPGPPVAAPVVLKRPAVSHGVKGRLHSRKELRRAFIMKEILSPPLSLR